VASEGQRTLALIAEMIHTSSLLHDDVIDEATTRRNKESVNAVFGDTQAIYAGDYILAKACGAGKVPATAALNRRLLYESASFTTSPRHVGCGYHGVSEFLVVS
jgi:geranylgeranyl pyrophosphate synthase